MDKPQGSVLVGARVEYVGPDLLEPGVWRGHPGVVVDVPSLEPAEVVVSLVAGPSFCFSAAEVRPLGEVQYRLRGERLITGKHPVEHRDVGGPLTAEGSHWP